MTIQTVVALFFLGAAALITLRLISNCRVDRFFSYSISMMFVIWYACPLLISIFDWEIFANLKYDSFITYETYAEYAILDLFFYILSVFGFLLLVNYKQDSFINVFIKLQLNHNQLYMKLCLYISCLIVLFTFLMPNSDYLIRNSVLNKTGTINIIDIINPLALSVLILYIVYVRTQHGLIHCLGSHVFFLLFCLNKVLGGARIALLAPLLVYAFLFFSVRKIKWKLPLAFALAGLMIISIIAGITVQKIRLRGSIHMKDISTELDSTEISFHNVIEQIGIKFNSTYYGSVLCEYDGIGSAGFAPYVNSVLALVPRYFYPDKPAPMSKDGTIYGHPIRLAGSYLAKTSSAMNAGIQPSQIALWHGSYFGYFLNIVFSALFLFLINQMLQSDVFIFRITSIFFLNFPQMEILMTFDEFLMKFPRIFILWGCLIFMNVRRINLIRK